MDPYQQYPSSPQGNPYEFILNPDKPSKKKGFGKGNNLAKTAAIIVGVAVVVMIGLTFALNVLAPAKVNTKDLTSVAQTQTEILRVSQQAVGSSVQQVTKNLATTIVFTMMTQLKQTLAVLTTHKVKVGTKELTLKQDATTDQKLAAAKTTSTYDQTYTSLAEASLKNYANTLKTLSTQSVTQSERDRLSGYYRQVQLLISQIPYAQNNITSAGTPQAAQ